MKTQLVHCSTLTQSFTVPCFNTSLSYSSIVARLCGFPDLLKYIDICDLQFQFVNIDNSGNKVISHTYVVDQSSYYATPRIVRLLRVPKSDIF